MTHALLLISAQTYFSRVMVSAKLTTDQNLLASLIKLGLVGSIQQSFIWQNGYTRAGRAMWVVTSTNQTLLRTIISRWQHSIDNMPLQRKIAEIYMYVNTAGPKTIRVIFSTWQQFRKKQPLKKITRRTNLSTVMGMCTNFDT